MGAGQATDVKLPKIPTSLKPFNGEGGSSVRTWLQTYDTIRLALRWNDLQSIAVCAMYLQDRAQQWWQEEGSIIAKDGKWKPFSRALQQRFTPNMNQLFIPKYTRNLSQNARKNLLPISDQDGPVINRYEK